ncbi:hypothetical protein SNOG_07684 [Parastagonospora nodorum SN15]|uniref:Uncharacterized protein n=1 Tax=Phaeosphaeria nodorum (strain SN15 / ATCC MYA-4574 / FGSC 10173) TaxID=321614 RepID=Q0UKN0_PHANO|nr:hypothetical protein SNOG_07684 [Parastagonospora nodorum SN15]EAT85150.1 hypothetical protein SNOG_07684 [Parastagonospora nodorum SN15]
MSCFGFYLQTLREHKTSVRRVVKIATRSLTELQAPHPIIYAMHIRSAQESTPLVTQVHKLCIYPLFEEPPEASEAMNWLRFVPRA